MGLLDEAIREHLDLMRRHGANEAEIARREAEALGPVIREEDEAQESGSPARPAEREPGLPYDRAAEAGLTGESDVPSFEWHGSLSGEPEVPSFVSPEPARHTAPDADSAESPADAEVASEPTEMLEVVEGDPGVEETELSVEPPSAAEEPELSIDPRAPESEGGRQEGRSAELSADSPVVPEPHEEAAAPEPEGSVDAAPSAARPEPPESEGSFAPGAEPDVALEPPAESALREEQPIEPTVPTDAEDGFAEAPPPEDETAFGPAPTEGDLAASPEPDSSEFVPGLGTEAAEEPALPPPDDEPPDDEVTAFHPAAVGTPEPPPAEAEELPPEPGPVTPEGGPLTLDSEDLPPEREPSPLTAGEVVEEPPAGLGLGEPPIEDLPEPPIEEPPIEEPFVAGEEEAWREAGETPGGTSDALPEPPLGGASSPGDLDPYPAPPVEPDAVLEPADEPPLDERPLQGPAPDAELAPPEAPDAPPGEPLDAPADSPPPLSSDSEAARGFFDDTAEHERPSREERPPTADPDFED